MSSTEVRELKEKEFGLWDGLVEASSFGTIFHKSYWLTNISKSLDKEIKFFGYFEDGELISGCPLYVFKMGFLKLASSTIKMTPYTGILLKEPTTSKIRKQERIYENIINSLRCAIERENFDYIRITNPPSFVDIRPFTWNGWGSEVRYEYHLNLKSNIKKHFSKNARYLIRKAIKNKITYEKLDNLDLSTYYELFSMTYRRQNQKPPATEDFIKNIFDCLETKNIGEMWIAKAPNGDVASIEIIVADKELAHCWSSANHTDYRKTGSNALLLYEISKDLNRRGFRELNLTTANTPHLAYYWTNFNPELVPYYCVAKKNIAARIGESIYKKMKGARY
jgi:hypothetical protein